MTVVVCDDISHGLVEHREECAQRSQACVVHNVLQLLTILQTLTDETIRHEGWLKHRSTVTLDLHKTMNVYNQPNSLNIYQGSFIHLFILAISIAPLQVLYYSEALQTTARILYRSFTPKRKGNCR